MSEYFVTNLLDRGTGSLRDGIIYANNNPNTTILFDVDVNGIIVLSKNLPKITKQTTILGNLNDSIPTITIDGKNLYNTLRIEKTTLCVIVNLCIINSSCSGITIVDSSYNEINNCWIGINTFENCSGNMKNGISIINSNNNIIGSNNFKNQTYYSNIISGNKMNGIYILNSKNNLIQNNIIGLNNNLIEPKTIPNKLNGIFLRHSKNNKIGGNSFIDNDGHINNPTGSKGTETPVFVRPLDGNLISGNLKNGICFCMCNENYIEGNFIGTDFTGTQMFSNQYNGIMVLNSDYTKILGCNVDTNPFIFYNVISSNIYAGIYLFNSKYTQIQGNFVGINALNSSPLGNLIGIVDNDSIGTVVGGIIPLGNVISGNQNCGIEINGNSSEFTSINSFLGTAAFGGAIPNGVGVIIDGTSSNIKINTNIISGNNSDGVVIKNNAKNIILSSNLVGLDAQSNPIPNLGSGIVITDNAKDILFEVQLTSVVPRNTISANNAYGLVISGNASGINLAGVFIGLNYIGESLISNNLGGLLITDYSNNNIIGNSSNAETYNYISDENNYAIKLTKNTHNNIVNYNFVNVDIFDYPVHHDLNIINESNKNIVYNNNVPFEN